MDRLMAGLVDDFLLESRERVDQAERDLVGLSAQAPEARAAVLEHTKRAIHTLKGNAGMMGFEDLRSLAHAIEDRIAALDPAAPDIQSSLAGLDEVREALSRIGPDLADAEPEADAESRLGGVRVSFAALDLLVEQIAEMVIFRNRLADAIDRAEEGGAELERVREAQTALGNNLSHLQDRVMALRMVPLSVLFGRLERIVHDECARAGKKARLETTGGETAMDKALIEVAHESLGHLVRNAVVHGIETPEVRAAAGKPAMGSIRLTAGTQAGEVRIELTDDGRGIDVDAVRRAAEEAGAHAPPGVDPTALLFMPGVTTADGANLSAGRGMGLSAVAEAVERVGGNVDVTSIPGRGATFRVRLPLTVSIARALVLEVDGEHYALPLSAVVETVRLGAREGREINNAEVMSWRRIVLPLLDLGSCFDTRERSRRRRFVVVIDVDGRQRGLIVDDLCGIREIVVKGLDPLVGEPPGISGATVLGDGRVILILDPKELAAMPPFRTGRREDEVTS